MHTTFLQSLHLPHTENMPSTHSDSSMQPCNIVPALLLAAMMCAGSAKALEGDIKGSDLPPCYDLCKAAHKMFVDECSTPMQPPPGPRIGSQPSKPAWSSPEDKAASEQLCRNVLCTPVKIHCKSGCSYGAAPLRKQTYPTE